VTRVSYDFFQPLDLRFRREDRHVIAFFAGHPEYEAAEAFVAARASREPLVRAILTRHDKTQVDLLNDPAALSVWRAANPSRDAELARIAFSVTAAPDPHAVLAFASHRGEAVTVTVAATTPALPAFGGLTDPAGHAPDVLPILYRDASAVGGARSAVTIDGRSYAIPPLGAGTAPLGVLAFYTEGFSVGIVATGTSTLRLLEAPEALRVGVRWRFADRTYELVELAGDRAVVARTSGVAETIEARLRDGRLHPTRITVASASERSGALVLSFDPALPDVTRRGHDPAGTFAIGVDAHERLVTGRIAPADMGFALEPEQPAWAAGRALRTAVARDGAVWTLRASVGGTP